jgi:hypothetical protein
MKDWSYIKDKIIVLGENDYVFADMFISVISEFENSSKVDLKIYTFKMLQELMNENLIDVFVLKNEMNIVNNILYKYENKIDIENFIKNIDIEWAILGYKFPEPNELFWITTNEKGKLII